MWRTTVTAGAIFDATGVWAAGTSPGDSAPRATTSGQNRNVRNKFDFRTSLNSRPRMLTDPMLRPYEVSTPETSPTKPDSETRELHNMYVKSTVSDSTADPTGCRPRRYPSGTGSFGQPGAAIECSAKEAFSTVPPENYQFPTLPEQNIPIQTRLARWLASRPCRPVAVSVYRPSVVSAQQVKSRGHWASCPKRS